jgi:hypothetical protein
MAQEVIDLLSQKVREILGILDMPDVDEDAIHNLIYRVGQTGKLQSLFNLQQIYRLKYSSTKT